MRPRAPAPPVVAGRPSVANAVHAMNATNLSRVVARATSLAPPPSPLAQASFAEEVPTAALVSVAVSMVGVFLFVCWLCIRALRDVAIAQERIRADSRGRREQLELQASELDAFIVDPRSRSRALAGSPVELSQVVREAMALTEARAPPPEEPTRGMRQLRPFELTGC